MIEIMIAMALVSVVFLGITSMITYSQRGARGVEKAVTFNEFVSTIQMILDNRDVCSSVFTGQTLSPGGAVSIAINGQTFDDTVNTKVAGGAIIITKLRFNNINNLVPPNPNLRTATIDVEADMKGTDLEARIGSPKRSTSLNTIFGYDPLTFQITGCSPPINNQYTVVVPALALAAVDATCTLPTDMVVTGGAKPAGVAPVWSWPETAIGGIVTAGIAPTGWYCSAAAAGQIQECYVVCTH